jgi:anaerobic magnesium-protoporphyrin IX monomethyl ester cyclase
MKVGLIFPNKDRKDKTVHLGLGYLASFARKTHDDLILEILDTRVAKKSEQKTFFETQYDLIGITCLSPVYDEIIDIVKLLKNKHTKTKICLGGPYVTTLMEDIFEETQVDFAVYGEGEITFSELIFALKGEKDLSTINGLIHYKDGILITNPPRDQISNLDDLPFPAYDLFHMERYPMHRIATSRGCPFKCVFCNSSSIWLGKWRKRSVNNIIEEIEFLIKNYNRKPFFFNDNSFNISLSRVEEFCTILIQKNLRILWTTPVRVEIMTEKVAQLMKKAGCYNVGIGIESANDEVLIKIKKCLSPRQITEGIKIFKDAGIEVLGQFVIGSPGDTLETIKESIKFAKTSDLDFVMFYSILPFKGTEQWHYTKLNGKFLYNKIHDFHKVHPRIVFETPEFPYSDRLIAINLAKKAGFYSEYNDRSLIFDIGKDVAKFLQQSLPTSVSDKAYIILKNIYRKRKKSTKKIVI